MDGALPDRAIAPDSAPTNATRFYVDPDYQGSIKDGTATHPFSSLGPSAWVSINTALASADVVIYFSALEADGRTQESQSWYLEVQRSDKSTHRLILDGHALYNKNDSSPSLATWVPNPTADIALAYLSKQVFKLTAQTALGWSRVSTYPRQSYVTLRGFETTGRVGFAGDYSVAEYLHIHDVTLAPAMAILYTTYPDNASCKVIMSPSTGMRISHVRIDSVFGEALYVGAVNPDCPDAVQCSLGNQHSNLLIEDVTIRNPGTGGGQGDGIDLKNGVTGVTIRNCDISGMNGMAGIILPQTFTASSDQQLLIENC